MEKKPTRSCLESFRHPHWDYSAAAAYFITIDTANMAHYFGHVTDGVMKLNQIGNSYSRFGFSSLSSLLLFD